MNRDYAGFLTQNITGFNNQTGGKDPIGATQMGCTLQSALNFNPNAIYEDGSCEWQSVFTSNPNALNSTCAWTPELGYHMWVNGTSVSDSYTDGSVISPCPYGLNYGCTDPEAQNYNPSAEQDWTFGDDYDTLCNYITDAKGKKGERVNIYSSMGGNDYGFSRSGFQSNGFTKGAPTSQPIAASFANACGCAV